MPFAAIPDITLSDSLALVDRVFDTSEIVDRKVDRAVLEDYYRQSDRGYRLFHSAEGAMHLCLNFDDEFDFGGLHAQPDLVHRHVEHIQARDILEAGCGNGFNLVYLAKKNPERNFLGVDWNDTHIRVSRKAGKSLQNLKFENGNYERLGCSDASFDLVMAVETLCQTDNLDRALRELHRILRPGGRLIWIDCFRRQSLDELAEELRLAATLVERSTAVNRFPMLESWTKSLSKIGFRILAKEDLTPATAPNVERLFGLARRFFNMSSGMWAMKKVFPPLMLQNAICGLLSPFTFGAGVHGYYALVVEKPDSTAE